MVSIAANYRRKSIMALSILVVLSQLAVLPAFSESKMSFYSEFLGNVEEATILLTNDKVLKVLLVTKGSIEKCYVEGNPLASLLLKDASVNISEKMTVHLPEGDGLSVGSFIVTVKVDNQILGQIYVSFTAKVSKMLSFEGNYRIVKGTGIFEKVRGYGTIKGQAHIPDCTTDYTPGSFVGYSVDGSVVGWIWGI
jgi:hypothetical protein